jgi:hypothetical protein
VQVGFGDSSGNKKTEGLKRHSEQFRENCPVNAVAMQKTRTPVFSLLEASIYMSNVVLSALSF